MADEDETTCIPEPLGLLFESYTINFILRELGNYLENVFSQYGKSYTLKHFDNLCKITKDFLELLKSFSCSLEAHRVERIKSLLAKAAFLIDQYSLSKFFEANTMQYNTLQY